MDALVFYDPTPNLSLNLSAYGYFRETSPTMAALAGRGVIFEHPISAASRSTSPLTSPPR
mgnify:CR=1 FL=1